ncbi:MAG: lasso peptide biosynthesis B2 protein [Rivularia sp. (in: Bacteria)]|nr:lasso peptide biosynthesis B2 protein [Rivularia sp. MS3]
MTLLRKLNKIFRLSPKDLYLVFVTFILLGTIRLGLRFVELSVLLKLVEKVSKPEFPLLGIKLIESALSPSKIVSAINLTTRNMPGGAKCLARALTVRTLMSRYGYAPELCIGVAKNEEKFEAHAWIEYQGQVIVGFLPDLPRYIPLPSIEGVKL